MKKKYFLVYVFVIVLFAIFIIVPVKEVLIRLNVIDFYKGDNWKIVPKSKDKIYDKIMTLESFIENRYNNYFPFYESINSTFYKSIINVDSLYLDDIYLKDNIDNEQVFYNKNNNFFYLVNKYSTDELTDRMNTNVDFYNDIKSKYPDIDLVIYAPVRYESSNIKNINDTYSLINDFSNKLNKSIKFNTFSFDNIDDYLKYYYRTDHHYNSYGAEIAYKDIMSMMNLNNRFNNIKHINLYDNYYGAMAKSTMLRIENDKLTAMDISNNLDVNISDKSFKPLTISNKPNPFYDYYVGYFNGAFDEIIYTNDKVKDKNLLVFGDSMSWQIDYILANSFHNTYVINTKYGKWLDNDLYLEEYIKEHNITHILFLREVKNIVFDADNYNLAKKVIR